MDISTHPRPSRSASAPSASRQPPGLPPKTTRKGLGGGSGALGEAAPSSLLSKKDPAGDAARKGNPNAQDVDAKLGSDFI